MTAAGRLVFNHAMIYTSSLVKSLWFYRDSLGFEVLEQIGEEYARLKSPGGDSTIALHRNPAEKANASEKGIRLYFEVDNLEVFCEALERKGVKFVQKPQRMQWGWDHAYLNDPDGNELSLYSAGDLRLRKSER